MYVAKDLGTVRIVHDGSPFDVLYDVKVERLVNGLLDQRDMSVAEIQDRL